MSRAGFIQFDPVGQKFASIWPTFFRYYRASKESETS